MRVRAGQTAGPGRGLIPALAFALAAAAAPPVLPALASAGEPPAWPFTTDFDSYLLHVHPEVNYALHPDWLAVWERERLGAGSFRGVFGSSATDELLVSAQWSLNPELADGLRLRHDIVWQQQRHLPFDRLELWLGLEWQLWRRLAVVVQTFPAERKEEIDLRLGALWTNADRTCYAQLLYVRPDLVHDEKDRRGGRTLTAPAGVNWLLRFARADWSFFSEGTWGRGFARSYADSQRAPELTAHARTSRELTVRWRWEPAPRAAVEATWFQAEDAERKVFREDFAPGGLYDYDYAGWYRLWSARGLYPVTDRWRLRGELHRLQRRAGAEGWRAFAYRRQETMPALFAEWSWRPRRIVEFGYLGTFYDWRYAGQPARRGYADKVELALALGLRGTTALKLSLSHEVSLERFGGGSVRLLTEF
jgi:hypothetical protein